MNFIPPSDRDISEGQQDGVTTRCLSLATVAELAESSPAAMLGSDSCGEIAWVNAQTEEMFGYTQDDLLGQSVGFLVPDRSRDILLAHHRTYSAEPRMHRMDDRLELYGRRKDGTEFPMDIVLSAIETNENHAVVLAVIRDTSKRNGAEGALHESQDRIRTILDHSPNLIFLKDVQGRYLFVNKEFQRVFHLSQEQIDGKKDEEVFPAEQAAVFRTNDPVITAIATRLNKTPAQVLLAWALQRGTALLTTSKTPSRIRENFDVSTLPQEAMVEIRERIKTQYRFNKVVETGIPGFIPRGR